MNKPIPPDWSQFALLLIDVQEDFWSAELREQFPELPRNIEALLRTCRSLDLEIIHIHASFAPNQMDWMARYRLSGKIPCISGTGGEAVMPFALPRTGETVLHKQTFDAFLQPELDRILRSTGKRFLLTAGIETSVCVLTTTLSATQRGYLSAVVGDCCADQTPKHHQVLTGYPFGFDTISAHEIPSMHKRWTSQLKQLAALEA